MASEKTIGYGKLVRDRIPEIITATGQTPQYRALDPHERLPALIAKLHEEADELASADRSTQLDELADIHEVLSALTSTLGFTPSEVETAATHKRETRGAFTHHLWLDSVTL